MNPKSDCCFFLLHTFIYAFYIPMGAYYYIANLSFFFAKLWRSSEKCELYVLPYALRKPRAIIVLSRFSKKIGMFVPL
jgi:hypothetical protein